MEGAAFRVFLKFITGKRTQGLFRSGSLDVDSCV